MSPKERGEEVLAIIESAGIFLSRSGDKIVARPSDLVTEAAASTIRNYKEEMLAALRRHDVGARVADGEVESDTGVAGAHGDHRDPLAVARAAPRNDVLLVTGVRARIGSRPGDGHLARHKDEGREGGVDLGPR